MKDARIKLIQDCVTLVRHSNLDDAHVAAKIYDLITAAEETEGLLEPQQYVAEENQ